MLTGFHGLHVFVGMLMLLFITLRLMKGHFTSQRHFGFEGAAWYCTLWTWCGWACTSSCTGPDARNELHRKRRLAKGAFVIMGIRRAGCRG